MTGASVPNTIFDSRGLDPRVHGSNSAGGARIGVASPLAGFFVARADITMDPRVKPAGIRIFLIEKIST
jgi:hypothetical protein